MDADLVRQIWLRADRIRARGLRTPDLTDLVDIASEFSALDWKLVADLSALLDGQQDVMARPRGIMEFINELSRRLHPGRGLDPFVVNPVVLVSAGGNPCPASGLGSRWLGSTSELADQPLPPRLRSPPRY